MPIQKPPALTFSTDELDLLGRTADALSAYMGKPVLAEVMDADETGFEWVVFASPLGTDDTGDDHVPVQIGGAGSRILGAKGGLVIADGDVFDCEYLWAIQLSALDGVRYIKVDQHGEEVAWTDELRDILPFALNDVAPPEDDEDEDSSALPDAGPDPRTLH